MSSVLHSRRTFSILAKSLAAVVICLLLGSCFLPTTPFSGIGASTIETGDVQIVLALCPGELVQAIEVGFSPTDQVVDEVILWRVTSSGQDLDRFVIGETPEGFAIAVDDWSSNPNRPDIFSVGVYVTGGLRSDGFSLGQLEPDSFRMNGRVYESFEDLAKTARTNCGSQ